MTQAGDKGPGGGTALAGRGTAAVLGRYLARSRAGTAPAPVPVQAPRPTPERALGLAIGRAGQKSCLLTSFPLRSVIGQATLAEMIELLPDRALIVIVEDTRAALGVVALSAGLLASVIEMQSLGQVSGHPVRERRPTRTDASICADFVNLALAELAAELGAMAGGAIPAFRFASFVEDPKPLGLMLEDIVYRHYHLDIRMGQNTQREAAFIAFLPAGPQPVPIARTPDPAETAPPRPEPRSLAGAVRAAPVLLTAVLCRKSLPLRELRALHPGALITLPFDAMLRARLETATGQLVAQGKLGAMHGHRAIRIGSGDAARPAMDRPDAPDPPFAFTGLDGGDDDDPFGFGENVFAAPMDGDGPPAFAPGPEPPLADALSPDPFRPDTPAEEEIPAMLPMNLVID